MSVVFWGCESRGWIVIPYGVVADTDLAVGQFVLAAVCIAGGWHSCSR